MNYQGIYTFIIALISTISLGQAQTINLTLKTEGSTHITPKTKTSCASPSFNVKLEASFIAAAGMSQNVTFAVLDIGSEISKSNTFVVNSPGCSSGTCSYSGSGSVKVSTSRPEANTFNVTVSQGSPSNFTFVLFHNKQPSQDEIDNFDEDTDPRTFLEPLEGDESSRQFRESITLSPGFEHSPNPGNFFHAKAVSLSNPSCSDINSGNFRVSHVSDEVIEPVNGELILRKKMKIHPNPTKSIFHIDYGLENESKISIFIRDLQGREIHRDRESQTAGNHSKAIDTKSFKPGIYFARIVSNEFDEMRRIVIQ